MPQACATVEQDKTLNRLPAAAAQCSGSDAAMPDAQRHILARRRKAPHLPDVLHRRAGRPRLLPSRLKAIAQVRRYVDRHVVGGGEPQRVACCCGRRVVATIWRVWGIPVHSEAEFQYSPSLQGNTCSCSMRCSSMLRAGRMIIQLAYSAYAQSTTTSSTLQRVRRFDLPTQVKSDLQGMCISKQLRYDTFSQHSLSRLGQPLNQVLGVTSGCPALRLFTDVHSLSRPSSCISCTLYRT